MKRQRGQAFILVLILLAVGSLVIVPVLNYTFTGLRSQQISEEVMTKQYAADAAVEDALWQMLDAIQGGLDPSGNYTFEFGLDQFGIDIEVPSLESDWNQYQQIRIKVEVQPNWLEANAENTTFTYILRFDMPQWDLSDFGFALPPGLTYTDNSTRYIGPEKQQTLDADASVNGTMIDPLNDDNWVEMTPTFNPLITEVDGRQSLSWRPYITGSGREVFIQAFQAYGIPPNWGIYYIFPSFTFESLTDPLETGATGAIGVAMYNITIDIEGVTYKIVVAYNPDPPPGGFEIISYQVLE